MGRDGKEIYLLTTEVPLRDTSGNISGIVGISRDVTEAKKNHERISHLNDKLKGRAEELTTLNGELEAFSYSVSHDLRAPLRHVVGFIKMLQKHMASNLDATSQRYLDIIAKAAARGNDQHEGGLGIFRLMPIWSTQGNGGNDFFQSISA